MAQTITNTKLQCWCGTDKWRSAFKYGNCQLLYCTNCHTYRNDPPPIHHNNESKEFYSLYYKSKEEKVIQNKLKKPSSRFWSVKKELPSGTFSGKRALDIGCGDGHLTHELKSDGWKEVIGTDLSTPRIQLAKKLYPDVTFYDKHLGKTPIQKNSVDLAIMDNVIEHLPAPLPFISEIKEYLSIQGQLVIITPNMESGNFKLLGKRWTPELCPHAHIFLFTLSSLCILAEKAGFEVAHKGNFSIPSYGILKLFSRGIKGDIKGMVWKSVQEAGNYYGKLIAQGEMIYIVLKKSSNA